MHANELILYVADQARAKAFYADVLGLVPTLDVPGMTEFDLVGTTRRGSSTGTNRPGPGGRGKGGPVLGRAGRQLADPDGRGSIGTVCRAPAWSRRAGEVAGGSADPIEAPDQ